MSNPLTINPDANYSHLCKKISSLIDADDVRWELTHRDDDTGVMFRATWYDNPKTIVGIEFEKAVFLETMTWAAQRIVNLFNVLKQNGFKVWVTLEGLGPYDSEDMPAGYVGPGEAI